MLAQLEGVQADQRLANLSSMYSFMPCTIDTTAIRKVTPISTPISEKKLFSFCARIVLERQAHRFEPGHQAAARLGDAMSLSTRPSRSTTVRSACAAMSASWVTMMMVWPCAVQLAEHLHDLLAGRAVEVAGGLVGQEDRGLVDQRAGDGDALALAARQLVGPVVHAVAQADPAAAPRWRGSRRSLRRDAGVDQRQLDVVERRGAGQQVERLEDEPDLLVAHPGQLRRRSAATLPAR